MEKTSTGSLGNPMPAGMSVPPQPAFAPAPGPGVFPKARSSDRWQLLFLTGLLLAGATLAWLFQQYLLASGTETLRYGTLAISALISGSVTLAFWTGFSARRYAQNQVLNEKTGLAVMAQVAINLRQPVSIADEDGGFTWVNAAFVSQFGVTPEQVYGVSLPQWLAACTVPEPALQAVGAALVQQRPLSLDLPLRRPDGVLHWWRLELNPFVSRLENLSRGCAVTFYDIDAARSEQLAQAQEMRDLRAVRKALDQFAIISETDRLGRITGVNQRFAEISGYTEQELLGATHKMVNSGQHPHEFWEHMWHTVSRGKPWRGTVCNRAKDGRHYWVSSLISPALNDDGTIEKFISIRLDITSYRAAEAALEVSQKMLKRTSSLAGTGGWYVDMATACLYVSAEAMHVLDLQPDWTVDEQGVKGYFVPQGSPATDFLLNTVLNSGQGFDLSTQITLSGDRQRHLRLVGDLDVWSGAASRMIGAVQDISAQIEARKRVEQSERTLRSAIDAMGEAFALFDPQERLVFCNDKYRAFIHSDPDALMVGTRYADVLAVGVERGNLRPLGRDASAWARERQALVQRESSVETLQLENGRWIRFVDQRSADGFHVALRVDITELHNALHEANAASRGKSEFLANMSHEIRTPMNAVMGMLRLLEYTDLNAKQMDLVGKASKAARSLLGVVNDILDFSKVEAGKMSLDPQPFDVEGLLGDVAVILSSTLGRKPLDLVFDVDPTLPSSLVGDALRLQQVLINLCGNAIKFTHEGEVALHVNVLQQAADSVRLRFEVRDTGIGLTAEQQSRLFQSYAQAEKSTARQFGGTGLGLTISQRLVDLMGGELTLNSAAGRGSVFAFELPFAVVKAQTTPVLPASAAGLSVLMVDDHEGTRRALQRACDGLGWRSHVFASIDDACQWGASADALGVRLDVVLVEAGVDAGRLKRQLAPVCLADDVVCLTLSSCGMEGLQDIGRPMQLEWEAVLIKPLTRRMLCTAVQQQRQGDGKSRAALARAAQALRLSGRRLLLVEDNAMNQEVACEMLSREGAAVTVVADGLAAVNLLQQSPMAFELVLMDMELPVMDGLSATRTIRQDPRTKALPIVAITANASVTDGQACLAAGMNGHVGKPFDLDELVSVILEKTAQVSAASGTPSQPAAEPVATQGEGLDEAVLDAARAIERLQGDAAFHARLARGFQDSAQALHARLSSSLAALDLGAVRSAAHQLKGSAATVGCMALSRSCDRAELWARGVSEGACPSELAQQARRIGADVTASVDAALSALEAALEGTWADTTATADSAATSSLECALSALERAASQAEMSVFEQGEALAQQLQGRQPEAARRLLAALEAFDMEALVAEVRAMRQSLAARDA